MFIFNVLPNSCIDYRTIDKLVVIRENKHLSKEEIKDDLIFKPYYFLLKKRNSFLSPMKYIRLHERILKIINDEHYFR